MDWETAVVSVNHSNRVWRRVEVILAIYSEKRGGLDIESTHVTVAPRR